jgi:hypothetical protein
VSFFTNLVQYAQKLPHKFVQNFFRKPIDKSPKVWYNKRLGVCGGRSGGGRHKPSFKAHPILGNFSLILRLSSSFRLFPKPFLRGVGVRQKPTFQANPYLGKIQIILRPSLPSLFFPEPMYSLLLDPAYPFAAKV